MESRSAKWRAGGGTDENWILAAEHGEEVVDELVVEVHHARVAYCDIFPFINRKLEYIILDETK